MNTNPAPAEMVRVVAERLMRWEQETIGFIDGDTRLPFKVWLDAGGNNQGGFDPLNDDRDSMRVYDRLRAMFPYEVTLSDEQGMSGPGLPQDISVCAVWQHIGDADGITPESRRLAILRCAYEVTKEMTG